MDSTNTRVMLPWFQFFSTENKMDSSNDSAEENLYKTESNSTCIQVKQVPIFPHGWCSKDCQVGSVVLYFSLSSPFFYPPISSLSLPLCALLSFSDNSFKNFVFGRIMSFLSFSSWFFVHSEDIRDWISFSPKNSMNSSKHVLTRMPEKLRKSMTHANLAKPLPPLLPDCVTKHARCQHTGRCKGSVFCWHVNPTYRFFVLNSLFLLKCIFLSICISSAANKT